MFAGRAGHFVGFVMSRLILFCFSYRYGCVKPEFLYAPRNKIVKPIWMVTKCDSDTRNDTLKEFCENPGVDRTFETLIPVSVGTVTYRNRFCALCYMFDDDINLYSWSVEFHCGTILQLPDKNLLRTVKEKQCNLNFIKPDGILVDECQIVPYTISECNVTGHWQQYDPMIEAGCHSFVDPFNLSFANVFCYLCNTDESGQSALSICNSIAHDNWADVSPPFSAILDHDVIKSMTEEETLFCNKYTQFKDEKMVRNYNILHLNTSISIL